MPSSLVQSRFTRRIPALWTMAAAILLPSLIYLLVSIGLGYRAERRSIEAATLARAGDIRNDVDARLREISATMRALATIRSIGEADWAEAAKRSQEIAALDRDWRNVTLYDLRSGQVLVTLRPDARPSPPQALRAIALRAVEPTFSNIVWHEGKPVLFAYLAVGKPGTPYLLRVTLTPDLVQRILLAHAPADGVSAVVDGKGRFIARSMAYAQRLGTPATIYLRQAIRHGRSGFYKGVTWEGLESYTGFETSPRTSWSSHVAVSSNILDVPQRWWRLTSMLAGLASIALGLIFSAFAFRMWRAERRADERMQQAERLETVGKLTGGVAHDFNNMLAIILGNLDLARRRLAKGDTQIGRYIDNAVGGAERAADLTRRLLAFSRRQPLAPVAVDVNRLITGMDEMLARTLGEDIAISLHLHDAPCAGFIDPALLENALINLAVNARDAMPGGGVLEIATSTATLDAATADRLGGRPGRYLRITVGDTGTGMTPEIAARAVEPFFTTKDVGRGTGLGLSQIHGFVTQSGGFIEIRSEPGEGTQVSLYLPCHDGPVAAPAHADGEATPRGAGEVLLVVEDEEQVRIANVEALRELGYTVRHAANGADALALITEQPNIALMVTDVVMPGMNGIELAERAAALLPEMRTLFVTGYERDARTDAIEDRILRKPFNLDQLARRVRAVLKDARVA